MNRLLRRDRFTRPTRFWHRLPDGRAQCDLCPRACRLRPGQRGFCFVRANIGGEVVLTTYGRSSGFCVDPVEKKPLNHFFPGSTVYSFGTAGCNLACRFCQNWDISKSRDMDILASAASPETIAATAARLGCRSVAFTYNDPVIFHEYAVDTAGACHARGIRTVAVTAGYINAPARAEFFTAMDAANVDLKAFNEAFYRRLTGARLQPVLETIEWIAREGSTWVELTTLLIPGENDSDAELHALCDWVMEHLGPDVPLHFTAFHPAYRMRDHRPTPLPTLQRARGIARATGIHHAYTGNAYDPDGQSTWCHACGSLLIGRSGYALSDWNIRAGGSGGGALCGHCGARIAGRFAAGPGD